MMREHLDIARSLSHNRAMRTTLNIDDDLLAAAKTLAKGQSESIGKALSELARRGLNATPRLRKAPRGRQFPVFAVSREARPITLEDVHRAEDDV